MVSDEQPGRGPQTAWELVETLTQAEAWRRDLLYKAGFGYLDAVELARDPSVDLHEACDLARAVIAKGKDVAYAVEILKPL